MVCCSEIKRFYAEIENSKCEQKAQFQKVKRKKKNNNNNKKQIFARLMVQPEHLLFLSLSLSYTFPKSNDSNISG